MLSFIKKYKIALISAAVIIAALVVAFMMGGNPSSNKEEAPPVISITAAQETSEPTSPPTSAETTASAVQTTAAQSTHQPTTAALTTAQATTVTQATAEPSTAAKAPGYKTDPIPSGKPEPVEPQEQTVAPVQKTITLSVNCATVFDNMKKLKAGKEEILPDDGNILPPTAVVINEGESVFDVLVRVCKDNKIHMEYKWTPIYNSAYIMGIGNLYEFDCGGNSGWMYKVDDWFPNYGCSRYVLEGGENVQFLYTCKLGYDIGGGAARQVDE